MSETQFTIAVVERDTGVAKETLRVWERRYGFPAPARDAHGERLYPAAQLERLRRIKRLMNCGHRPGRLMTLDDAALSALETDAQATASTGALPPPPSESGAEALLAALRSSERLRQHLSGQLVRGGLAAFVTDTVPTMNRIVGELWASGQIDVYAEHLYTEQLQTLLRQAIATLPEASRSPRILLTTVPEERHGLGLLLAEALLRMEGANCVSLGTQTPLVDIAGAASGHAVDIVALSFSSAFPARQIPELLRQLRPMLPERTTLWAGGAGVERLSAGDAAEAVLLTSLAATRDALTAYRQQAAAPG